MEKNTRKIIIMGAVLIVLAVAGLSLYFYYINISKVEQSTVTDTAKTKTKSSICGNLTADNNLTSGPAPFAPILRGKLTGSYDTNAKICNWYIDNATAYSSFPVKGECVFGGNGLMTKGEHIISYKITGENSCEKSIKVTVE